MGRRDDSEPGIVAFVGKRLRELRGARGLSQARLAEAADLTLESISRAERGATEISLTSLEKICTALNVPLAEFFGTTSPGRKRRPAPQPDAQRLVKLLHGRSKHDSRRVLAIVRLALDA